MKPCLPSDLGPAVLWLRAGGIVAFPTDTLYGLAVDPTSTEAVRALFEAKGRPAGLAVPLVAASAAQVEAFCGPLHGAAARLAAHFWPGPLSLVCDAPVAVDAGVHGGHGTVAIRVPDHAVARALAGAWGAPVTATSANRTGEPPASRADEVARLMTDDVLIIDGGPATGGPPSTIVDARGEVVVLVRAGAIPWSRVLESLEA